jgi:hypothetical protein
VGEDPDGSPPPRVRHDFGTAQVVFLATMVALDFAFGWVAKPLVQSLGLGSFLKVEMIPAVMLMLLARLTLDRFGVLIAYQAAWGLAATVLMPGAVLPGPLKLVPLMFQGLVLDGIFSGCRRWARFRTFAASAVGGLAGTVLVGGLRVLMGMPWARSTQAYLGLQLLGSLLVHLAGAGLTLMVWRRVREHPALQWLQAGR